MANIHYDKLTFKTGLFRWSTSSSGARGRTLVMPFGRRSFMFSKMEICSSVFAIAGSVALALATTPAQAQEAWKHGIVEAKGDSGFLFQAAEGGFGKKRNLDID